MFDHLQIPDRRERWLVGGIDLALAPAAGIARWRRRSAAAPTPPPRRVLLFRLERIGDLILTLDAIAALRSGLPDAELRLVVGRWNADLARLCPAIDAVDVLDAPWLARGGGRTSAGAAARQIARWRRQRIDLAINFEPDVRSNALAAASGARRRLGYATGGGGAFLTDALRYDPTRHAAVNARRLVERALPPAAGRRRPTPPPQLAIPPAARARAAQLLAGADRGGPLVGLAPGAGRAVKEWPADRFGRAGAALADRDGATIVLLGSTAERAHAEAVRAALPAGAPLIDLVGQGLVDLAAILARLTLLVTGDTGPMHLAAAVGTPVVAVFGPTDPRRYAPRTPRAAVVHADLWCRPCHRVRRPPARCTGRTPDCLDAVSVDAVVEAARQILRHRPPDARAAGTPDEPDADRPAGD